MKFSIKHIFTVVLLLFPAILVPAGNLPQLPDDPAILKGNLPNGLSYYIVSNPSVKGKADFALVQKVGKKTASDSSEQAAEQTREALTEIYRINSTHKFLTNHHSSIGRDGFAKVTDDATIYKFSDIGLSSGKNVLDSTLLVIMGIIDRPNRPGQEHLKKEYTPYNQAVIVSGDVDSKQVAEKLLQMSYMVVKGDTIVQPEFHRTVEPKVVSRDNGLSTISYCWTAERASKENMNTLQQEVLEKSVNILGQIAQKSIRQGLRDLDIPVADVSYRYISASTQAYDDMLRIQLVLESKNEHKAMEIVEQTMASIDRYGVSEEEYLIAEMKYYDFLEDDAGRVVRPNSEYVEKCADAFLYNASLATTKDRLAFYRSRSLPEETRTRFFNDIASAYIEVDNLEDISPRQAADSICPIVPEPVAVANKIKVSRERKEPLSGGVNLTFSNGFKLIYMKLPVDRIYYTLALGGGYTSIDNLQPGEGAYVSDYLKTCRVAGMTAERFQDFLTIEEVSMDMTVNMSNTLISGSLPKDKLEMLFASLLALANEREEDQEAFEYSVQSDYLTARMLRNSSEGRLAALDSLMFTSTAYSSYKREAVVSDGFLERTGDFFDRQFSKMGDGVLVLVGNLDENKIKKAVADYSGGFKYDNVPHNKFTVRYQPKEGHSFSTVKGGEESLDLVISIPIVLSADKYFSLTAASMLLERKMSPQLYNSGYYASFHGNTRIYPDERFSLLISVQKINEDGLSLDVRQVEIGEELLKFETMMNGKFEISGEDLNQIKNELKNGLAQEMKSPQYWMQAISYRYLYGKDLTSNYASKIDAITVEQIESIYKEFNFGSRVEYLITK